jgi:hypothetical protein
MPDFKKRFSEHHGHMEDFWSRRANALNYEKSAGWRWGCRFE